MPPNSREMLRLEEERRRLGSLKFAKGFTAHLNFVLLRGPSVNLMEIWGRIPGTSGPPSYKDNILFCMRGKIRLHLNSEEILLSEGDAITNGSDVLFEWMEPGEPIGNMPPLILIIAANRISELSETMLLPGEGGRRR